jgi:hypothetical protein
LITRPVPDEIDPLFTLKLVPVPGVLPTMHSKQSASVLLAHRPLDTYLVLNLGEDIAEAISVLHRNAGQIGEIVFAGEVSGPPRVAPQGCVAGVWTRRV